MLDKRRVLIVMNEETYCNRCKKVLEDNEVAYDISINLKDALERIQRRSYEAVILYNQNIRKELLKEMEKAKIRKPVMVYSETPIDEDASLVVQSSSVWNRREFQKFLDSYVW